MLVNERDQIITGPNNETGLLLYNKGTVCNENGALDHNTANAICRSMGYKSAGYLNMNMPHQWGIQKQFKTSISNIFCSTNNFSLQSCSYDLGPKKNCENHNKDVFINCHCHHYSSCPPCPANTYKKYDGNSTRAICENCPENSSSPPNSASCTCISGLDWDDGECKPCLPGFFISGHMTSCKLCPINTTSDIGSGHCICPAGMFWNSTKCQNCEQGSVSQPGALRCQICPLKSSKNGTSCECPSGEAWSWNEEKGSCNYIETQSSASIKLLLGCNVVLLCVIISILAMELVVEFRKKMRQRRRLLEFSIENSPGTESAA